jgi:hypothetical protein
LGIAVFIIAAQWIITKYRVNKIEKADKEVILTLEGALVGDVFHVWRVLFSFLSNVKYFNHGDYKGCEIAIIRITYLSISGTIVAPYTFIIPVPSGYEYQAEKAAQRLRGIIKSIRSNHFATIGMNSLLKLWIKYKIKVCKIEIKSK